MLSDPERGSSRGRVRAGTGSDAVPDAGASGTLWPVGAELREDFASRKPEQADNFTAHKGGLSERPGDDFQREPQELFDGDSVADWCMRRGQGWGSCLSISVVCG